MRHIDQEAKDAARFCVCLDLTHKAHIDLEDIKIIIPQHTERRITASKIIQQNFSALFTDCIQHSQPVLFQCRIGSLRHLKADHAARNLTCLKLLNDPVYHRLIVKIHPGEVD